MNDLKAYISLDKKSNFLQAYDECGKFIDSVYISCKILLIKSLKDKGYKVYYEKISWEEI